MEEEKLAEQFVLDFYFPDIQAKGSNEESDNMKSFVRNWLKGQVNNGNITIKPLSTDEIMTKVSNEKQSNVLLGSVYTENEVSKLLETQRGNCYVAVLTKTRDKDLAKIASDAPEPAGGKWKKSKFDNHKTMNDKK